MNVGGRLVRLQCVSRPAVVAVLADVAALAAVAAVAVVVAAT